MGYTLTYDIIHNILMDIIYCIGLIAVTARRVGEVKYAIE